MKGQAQVLQQLIGEVQQELRELASTQQQQQQRGDRRTSSSNEPAASPGAAATAVLGKRSVAELLSGVGSSSGNARTITTGAAGLMGDVLGAQLQRGPGGWATGCTVTSDPERPAVLAALAASHLLPAAAAAAAAATADQGQQQQEGVGVGVPAVDAALAATDAARVTEAGAAAAAGAGSYAPEVATHGGEQQNGAAAAGEDGVQGNAQVVKDE
jgi:hypothetical protein